MLVEIVESMCYCIIVLFWYFINEFEEFLKNKNVMWGFCRQNILEFPDGFIIHACDFLDSFCESRLGD